MITSLRHGDSTSNPQRIARALGWLGILALAIGTWRAFPRPTESAPSAPGLRAVVLDASAGTTRRRRDWGPWARRALREQAILARDRGEELAVVLYGGDVRALRGDADPQDWIDRLEGAGGRTLHLRLDGEAAVGSELDRAVSLLEQELLEPDRLGATLVLIGEDDYSGPDPAPRLARLERGGVSVRRIPPPPATWPDLALEKLSLPRDPEVGAPLVSRLDLALHLGGESPATLADRARITVHLVIDAAEQSERRELELDFPDGPPDLDGFHRWSVRVDLGPARPGLGRVTARVRLTAPGALREGDPIPQNDTRSGAWRTGDVRVVAAVARGESMPELRAWLGEGSDRWPGLQWIFLEPQELGSVAPDLDALLSFDLSPRELPEAYVSALLDRGGGWLFCGGWGILAPWAGRAGHPSLADRLPLRPAAPDAPDRDVLFLVDGSGSMEGEPFDRVKAALSELVAIVSESDSLGLHFFTASLGSRIDLDARGGRGQEVLQRLFATRVPGGPTAIIYSMERLVEERAETDREALVILLSDGRDYNAFDVERRGAEIRRALTELGVRLRILAVGDEADLELLSALLGPGEELVHAEDLDGLAELFRREVLGTRVRHGEFTVIPAERGALEISTELLSTWAAEGVAPPPLNGYLFCEVKESADILWHSSKDGEVQLALHRSGTGLVAAWPSAPLPGWAPAYRTADAVLAPLLRALSRGARRPAGITLEVIGDRLVLSGVPESWPARVDAKLFASIPGAPMARELFLKELASAELLPPSRPPGLDPRSERGAPLPPELAKLPPGAPLHVELVGEGIGVLGHLALEVPPPAEFSTASPRLRPGPWASPGEGHETRPTTAHARTDPRAWWWLLGGCLSLFLGALLSSLWGERVSTGSGAAPALRAGSRRETPVSDVDGPG